MTDKRFDVRSATRDDAEALVTLMSEFYAESGLTVPREAALGVFQTLLDSPQRGAVWLAEVNGRAAGHVVLTVAFSMEYGGLRGFIDDLYVQESHRGRGIGAALLAAARDGAVASGLRAICVETGLDDHPARALYERAGYVDTRHALLVQPLERALHQTHN